MTVLHQFLAMRPFGGFDLIMADPPWKFENFSAAGEGRNATAHYDCMPIDAIMALPVEALAARDALLWLWATAPLLSQALDVIDAWGFTYKTSGHWVKLTRHGKLAFGTGYILRNSGEPFLIATRGAPKTARNVRSVIMAEVREHSRKPDAAFTEAQRLVPDAKRLELFSRQQRPGWTSWGDQIEKFEAIV